MSSDRILLSKEQFLLKILSVKDVVLQIMKSERCRLNTFISKWPLNYIIKPESLSEAGFLYIQYSDKVLCPFCGIIVFNWIQGQKPLREHIKKNPKCPFLIGQDVGNIPLNLQKDNIPLNLQKDQRKSGIFLKSIRPKNSSMCDVKNRLWTYSHWHLNEPKPQQLAECGFYYSGIADVVCCFCCNGTLGNWEPDDDPWFEHAKFFPNCSFLNKTCLRKLYTLGRTIELALLTFPNDLVFQTVTRYFGDEIIDSKDIVEKRFESKFSLQERDEVFEQNSKDEKERVVEKRFEQKSERTQSNDDLLLCKVCMNREKGVVFQPCGHFITCLNCSSIIADCPVCRKTITHKIRTFVS